MSASRPCAKLSKVNWSLWIVSLCGGCYIGVCTDSARGVWMHGQTVDIAVSYWVAHIGSAKTWHTNRSCVLLKCILYDVTCVEY